MEHNLSQIRMSLSRPKGRHRTNMIFHLQSCLLPHLAHVGIARLQDRWVVLGMPSQEPHHRINFLGFSGSSPP